MAPQDAAVWVEREAIIMGTRLTATVRAPDRATGFDAIEAVFGVVRALEAAISSWRDDSDLARVNGAPPTQPVVVPHPVFELLREAAYWRVATGGAFDPAVGALIDAWDLRGAGRRPDARELRRARAAAGMHLFRFDDAHHALTRTHERGWIDAGAFGKGAALRSAREVLARHGIRNARLNFGGQVLVVTSPDAHDAWEIAVADPTMRDRAVAVLRIRDRSVATTSQGERSVLADGERFGHVLDPRSGRPAPAWGSVTVIAGDPLVADILSTALFVMGVEQGVRWLSTRPRLDATALFMSEGVGGIRMRGTPGIEHYLVVSGAIRSH